MDSYVSSSDEDINVGEIMKSIRDEIRKKKVLSRVKVKGDMDSQVQSKRLEEELNRLKSYQNICNSEYTISSHRKFIGPILVNGRKLVNSEVKRYINPILLRQQEFNTISSRVAASLIVNVNDITGDVSDIISDVNLIYSTLNENTDNINGKIGDIDQRLASFKSEVSAGIDRQLKENDRLSRENDATKRELYAYIDKKIQSLKEELTSTITGSEKRQQDILSILYTKERSMERALAIAVQSPEESKLAYTQANMQSIPYLPFENTFRGKESDISERQKFYLKYFQRDGVLDVGCGRGEFLELLREKNIKAVGIDTDNDLINYCLMKGLDVKKADVFDYLISLDDGTIGGLFMAQVIEHIEPACIPGALGLIYEKLAPGSYLVVETVNILNIGALMNFYIDPTHVRPVHPLYLEYLFKSSGFRDVEVIYRDYSGSPDTVDPNKVREIAPDYAVVGKK